MVTYLLSLYPDLFLISTNVNGSSPAISPLNFMTGTSNTYAAMASCNP